MMTDRSPEYPEPPRVSPETPLKQLSREEKADPTCRAMIEAAEAHPGMAALLRSTSNLGNRVMAKTFRFLKLEAERQATLPPPLDTALAQGMLDIAGSDQDEDREMVARWGLELNAHRPEAFEQVRHLASAWRPTALALHQAFEQSAR